MSSGLVEAYQNWLSAVDIRNGVNITLTCKQSSNGFILDKYSLIRNTRYFKNILNSEVYGNAYRRYNKQLKMLIVFEESNLDRLHLHGIVERPKRIEFKEFEDMIVRCWKKTMFGYDHNQVVNPTTFGEVVGWKNYIMKKRSKKDFSGSIDLENSYL